MNGEKLSIFLSHSHADIDKVRKIRDVLETLECEPLIFFLKCLDDDNDELEDFIKREIEKRSLFLYCKSENAENSVWVQKELEYIRSFDKNRVYTVEIDDDFSVSLLKFLSKLTEIFKENRIFLSYSRKDLAIARKISAALQKSDFSVYDYDNLTASGTFLEQIKERIESVKKEGAFVFIISENSLNSEWVMKELAYAFANDVLIVPVLVGSAMFALEKESWIHGMLCNIMWHKLSAEPTEEELNNLVKIITKRIKSSKNQDKN